MDEVSIGDLVKLRGKSLGFILQPGLVLQVESLRGERIALVLFPDLQKPEWISTNYLLTQQT